MAFQSQMAAQREQSKQRLVIRANIFTLQTSERKLGNKKDNVLKIRVPLEHLKAAKIDVKKPIDLFFDHENYKAMLANSLGGQKFIVRGQVADGIFVFAKGFTPDFAFTHVERFDVQPHGEGQGIVFDFRPRMMVEGLNALKEGEQPTRAQRLAVAVVAEEDKRLAERRAPLPENVTAPPASTQKYDITVKPEEPQDGLRTRRHWTDEQKKEGVRAHLRWMDQGLTFRDACKELEVGETQMRQWREKFLKEVEAEERRLGTSGRRKAVNSARAH